MVVPTLLMKSCVGELEGRIEAQVPRRRETPKMFIVVSNDFEMNYNVYPMYLQNGSMKPVILIFYKSVSIT